MLRFPAHMDWEDTKVTALSFTIEQKKANLYLVFRTNSIFLAW